MKKVIIDKFVPFEGNPFEGIAQVQLLAPAEFTPEAVRDADALIVRTRTKCNANLLDGSKVSIVATATIGTDHFDFPYLASKGIRAVSAPGCNAPAVAQYVYASIFALGLGQPGMRLGIVGLGHVGSIVASWAKGFGIEVLACDPPRQRRDGGWDANAPFNAGSEPFYSLEEVARKADVLTFHTPLTRTGQDATFHLGNRDLFNVAPKALVINAARGPVIDTADTLAAIKRGKIAKAAIDCWEGEPVISLDLMQAAVIATPHIAGYSLEGKRRATAMTFNAVLEHFGSDRRIDPQVPMVPPTSVTREAVIASYNPFADTEILRAAPATFEHLRDSYALRHEVPF
jgi:erythronate-4-phosphate dehydrogenase